MGNKIGNILDISFATYKSCIVLRSEDRPLKLPLGCSVRKTLKIGGFGAPIFRGGGISDMHFQITLTSEHVAGFG